MENGKDWNGSGLCTSSPMPRLGLKGLDRYTREALQTLGGRVYHPVNRLSAEVPMVLYSK